MIAISGIIKLKLCVINRSETEPDNRKLRLDISVHKAQKPNTIILDYLFKRWIKSTLQQKCLRSLILMTFYTNLQISSQNFTYCIFTLKRHFSSCDVTKLINIFFIFTSWRKNAEKKLAPHVCLAVSPNQKPWITENIK